MLTRSASAPKPLVASRTARVGISSSVPSGYRTTAARTPSTSDRTSTSRAGREQLDVLVFGHSAGEVVDDAGAVAARDRVAAGHGVAGVVEVRDQRQRQPGRVREPLDQRGAHLGQGPGQPRVGLPVRLGHDVGDEPLGRVVDTLLGLPAGAGAGEHRRGHRGVVPAPEVLARLDDQHAQAQFGRAQGPGEPAARTGDDEVGSVGHRCSSTASSRIASCRRVDDPRGQVGGFDVDGRAAVDHRRRAQFGQLADGRAERRVPRLGLGDRGERQVQHADPGEVLGQPVGGDALRELLGDRLVAHDRAEPDALRGEVGRPTA